MSGFDQSSIAVSMPTVVGADAALGGPYKIKPSEAFSGALMTVSGLTGETISVETSPDGYWGAPASPTFYRTDWQGTQLLYSTARTNIILQSQTFSDAIWIKDDSTLGSLVTAPDGTTTATPFIASAANVSTHRIRQPSAMVGAQPYVWSVFIKPGARSWVQIRQGALWANVNVTTGEKGFSNVADSNFGLVALPNGWYRCWIYVASVAVASVVYVTPDAANTNNIATGTFAGDGVTPTIYIWGADVKNTTTLSGYVGPTLVAPATITDYTLSNGVITLAEAPVTGATLSYDNSVLPSPYYIFATGDGVRTQFAYDGVWGTLSANSGKGNGIWQVDLRGAQAYRLVKSAGAETATVNMTLKRDALQYKNTAGTWSVT